MYNILLTRQYVGIDFQSSRSMVILNAWIEGKWTSFLGFWRGFYSHLKGSGKRMLVCQSVQPPACPCWVVNGQDTELNFGSNANVCDWEKKQKKHCVACNKVESMGCCMNVCVNGWIWLTDQSKHYTLGLETYTVKTVYVPFCSK